MARSSFILAPLVLLAPVSVSIARADDPNAKLPAPAASLWGENSLWQTRLNQPSSTLKLSDATNLLADQFSLLGQLREWSGTLRGSGKTPMRMFKFGEFNKQNINFVVGAQQLPSFDLASFGGNMSGMSLQYGRLTIGSTQGQQALNRALLAYDTMMSSDNGAAATLVANDESATTWIALQPMNSSLGKLDLIMARGSRDLTPSLTSDKQLVNGMQFGAHGDFNLPIKWKLRSEWMQSRMSNRAEPTSAWKLNFNGPIKHPWGVMTASANFNETQGGFATLGNPTPAEGRSSSDISLQQGIAHGDVTGSMALSLTGTQRTDIPTLTPGIETANSKTSTNTDLHWKLSPSLGVFAKHNYSSTTQEVLVDPAAGSETKNSAVVSTGDVGLEMKVTKSLAVTVSGGQTQSDTATLLPAADSPMAAKTNDDRIAIGIQRRTSGGLFALQMARHSLSDCLTNNPMASADSMQLNAERQVLPALRLKGSYLWSDSNDLLAQLRLGQATRSAEAQFALTSLGTFDLTYSDWMGNNNGIDPVTGASLDGARTYGVRFNMGSAVKGNGLGVAVEYSLQDVKIGSDTTVFKVGLTYK